MNNQIPTHEFFYQENVIRIGAKYAFSLAKDGHTFLVAIDPRRAVDYHKGIGLITGEPIAMIPNSLLWINNTTGEIVTTYGDQKTYAKETPVDDIAEDVIKRLSLSRLDIHEAVNCAIETRWKGVTDKQVKIAREVESDGLSNSPQLTMRIGSDCAIKTVGDVTTIYAVSPNLARHFHETGDASVIQSMVKFTEIPAQIAAMQADGRFRDNNGDLVCPEMGTTGFVNGILYLFSQINAFNKVQKENDFIKPRKPIFPDFSKLN